MRFRFELDGEAYSKHKDAFKRVLAKHGLRWQGSLEHPLWASRAERVSAVFDRDEAHDVLRSATLVWQGPKKSELLEELKLSLIHILTLPTSEPVSIMVGGGVLQKRRE